MHIFHTFAGTPKTTRALLGLTAAAALCLAPVARADNPAAMAPPVQTDTIYSANGDADYEQPTNVASGADSVFNWREIPANQRVPLTRAAFDKGGYQLYDNVGETIVVPFTNQNLYVMKFGQSDNGTMYFVNTGTVPILYVPRDGFLDNAAVPGTRWYPLGNDFHPAEPVFLGIAPSWPEFVSLGWYPDECYYGGYWGHRSFVEGGLFLPTVGLFFVIGGEHYDGWHGYRDYRAYHPDYIRIDYYNRDYYRWANRPRETLHEFGGGGGRYFAHQEFAGAGHVDGGRPFGENRGFGGGRFAQGGNISGGRVFRGAGGYATDGRGYSVPRDFGGGRPAAQTYSNGGGHTFRGAADSGQNGRGFGGGTRTFDNGRTDNAPVFNGTRGGDTHAFNGGSNGDTHPFSGARGDSNRTFNGTRGDNAPVFRGNGDAAAPRDTGGSHDNAPVFNGGSRGSGDTHTFQGGSHAPQGDGGGRAAHADNSGGGGRGSHDGDRR